jgi:hypothetical protein
MLGCRGCFDFGVVEPSFCHLGFFSDLCIFIYAFK